MSLDDKIASEVEYYRNKLKDVMEEIDKLEKRVGNEENMLDSILDEVEIAENLLAKVTRLVEEKYG